MKKNFRESWMASSQGRVVGSEEEEEGSPPEKRAVLTTTAEGFRREGNCFQSSNPIIEHPHSWRICKMEG